jgi:ABC-type nickel/cobalt efflux system permease component RcnA
MRHHHHNRPIFVPAPVFHRPHPVFVPSPIIHRPYRHHVHVVDTTPIVLDNDTRVGLTAGAVIAGVLCAAALIVLLSAIFFPPLALALVLAGVTGIVLFATGAAIMGGIAANSESRQQVAQGNAPEPTREATVNAPSAPTANNNPAPTLGNPNAKDQGTQAGQSMQ